MSDRIATEIRIGGQVKRDLVPALLEAIEREGLEADWDVAMPRLGTEEDLSKHLSKDGVLRFCASYAVWGSLPDLETFLVENGIAFDRHHGPYADYSGETRRYRPGVKEPIAYLADDGGNFLIEATAVKDVRHCLKSTRGKRGVRGALRKLDRLLAGTDIPDLAPFLIAD